MHFCRVQRPPEMSAVRAVFGRSSRRYTLNKGTQTSPPHVRGPRGVYRVILLICDFVDI